MPQQPCLTSQFNRCSSVFYVFCLAAPVNVLAVCISGLLCQKIADAMCMHNAACR